MVMIHPVQDKSENFGPLLIHVSSWLDVVNCCPLKCCKSSGCLHNSDEIDDDHNLNWNFFFTLNLFIYLFFSLSDIFSYWFDTQLHILIN